MREPLNTSITSLRKSGVRRIQGVLLIGLCAGLAACGYSLRDSDALTDNFATLSLELQQPNSDLARMMRRNLDIASVTVISEPQVSENADTPLLRLGAEEFVSRPVSVTPQARAAQYELRLGVEVMLSLAGEPLLGPETLIVERSYFEDIENISGNREELEIITTEMRRDLVNQLMRRLQAVEY